MKKVAVVILNWNGKKFLEKFIPVVLKYNPSFSEIVLADNASTDDSVEFIKTNFPEIRIVINGSNHGYAKGYNDALSKLDHEYFVLLNSDVEVTPCWLEPMLTLLEKNVRVAACQPKLLAYNDKKMFEYAGAAGGFIDKYGFPFCRGRIFNSFEEDKGQYNDDKEIFWATGACMLVRASAFRDAGGLDEDFFAHMEEIDLCWRMKNLGHKIMYCAGSTVFHVGGGTLNKSDPKKTFLNFRNNLILLCKNHASGYFFLKMTLRLKMDGWAAVKFLFGAQFSHFFAVLKAHWSFYGTLGKTRKKRRAMKKRISSWSTTAIYRKSIVIDYFLRGKNKFSMLNAKKFGS